MTLLAASTGQIERIPYRGRQMRTGIFKRPVEGPVHVTRSGLDGDRQADPRYHGGPEKAVYLYPSEHYPYWREMYPELTIDYGMFGENLTTSGLLESDLPAGTRLRIGTAEFQVTEPRTPCVKLGLRFGRRGIIAKFKGSGRTGVYLSVSREGTLTAGDSVELLQS